MPFRVTSTPTFRPGCASTTSSGRSAGYRTRGRRPAEIFYADCPGLLVEKGWDADELGPQSVRS